MLTKPNILILLLLLTKVAHARQENVREIQVGDVIPNVKLNKILNYTSSTASLSDFKGKLIIIDFWATWCTPCVGAFPKLDSIQNEFKDQIQILPVTSEKENTVKYFFGQLEKLKKKVPLSIVNDSILRRMFKHVYLPHCIWIDKAGKVIAITDGKDVNTANVKAAIEGKGFAYKLKNDVPLNIIDESERGIPVISAGVKVFDQGKIQYTRVSDSLLFVQTALTQTIDGLGGGSTVDSCLVGVWNVPVIWLYKVALWKHGMNMLNEQKTIAEIPDTRLYELITASAKDGSRIVQPGMEYSAWLKQNGYCYQVKVPAFLSNQKYDIMVEDLNRFFGAKFGIEGRLEKRLSPCLVLERTSNSEKFAAKASGDASFQQTKVSLQVRNFKMDGLISFLAQPMQQQPPIINETNYKGRIDLDINCFLSDLEALNVELGKYDLRLVKKDVMQEIGVIKMIGDGAKVKR